MLRIVSAQVKSAQYYDDVSDAHDQWLDPDFGVPERQSPQYKLVGETADGKTVELSHDTIDESEIEVDKAGLRNNFQEFWDEFQVVSIKYIDVEGGQDEFEVREYEVWVEQHLPQEPETPPAMPMESPASPPPQPMARPFLR